MNQSNGRVSDIPSSLVFFGPALTNYTKTGQGLCLSVSLLAFPPALFISPSKVI